MAKNLKTSGGLDKLLHHALQKNDIVLSEKMVDKVTIISFFDDMWQGNLKLEEEEKLSKRQIIEKAHEVFNIEYSVLYRTWTEGQDKLGLSAIMPKNALMQYIVNKSMILIDREEAKAEPDNKAAAMLLRNLTTIAQQMPDEEEEREPLFLPIFEFNPELLANYESISKIDIPKVLAELRAKDFDTKKLKPKIGDEVDFEEIQKDDEL